MTIGQALAVLREEAGLSQEQLGELLGADQRTVSRLENDQQRAYLDQVLNWEEACGAPAGQALRTAGVVEAEPKTTEGAIRADPGLDGVHRRLVLDFYEFAVARTRKRR